MSSELIVIEQTTAIAVLSTDDGVKTLLENVRANIDSMDGGSMKNKTSRAKIRSNAFAATKAYKKINDETIEPLIANLTAKIQPQLNVINAIRDNQSVLKSGLQQIRKDVNADVDAFEADLQRIEDEKIELERVATVERDREFAAMMYSEYLAQIALGDSILADLAKLAEEKAEAERIAYEKKIADDAAEAARLESEQKAKAEIKRVEDEKQLAIQAQKDAELLAEQQAQAAIQAELDAEEAERLRLIAVENENNLRIQQEKQRKIDADNAEKLRIQQEKQRVIDANNAEKQRLADVEQARINEANRIEADRLAKEKQINDATLLREKNKKHMSAVMTQTKESIIALGLSEEDAKKVTTALRAGLIANVSKIQF